MKGLALQGLDKREEGEKLLKESLKINMKNSTVWYYYGIFNKESKNFNQAAKCYTMAHKYDPNNFNVVRDLSYLCLFLGRFDEFLEYSRDGLTINSTVVCNWIQFSFALYLNNNYEEALKQINAIKEIGKENMKKQEYSQVALYKGEILYKTEKYKECIEELESEIEADHCSDRYKFYELIIRSSLKLENTEIGLKYTTKMLEINPENIDVFLLYFNLKYPKLNLSCYESLFKLKENSEEMNNLYNTLKNEIEPLLKKAKIIDRLELALSSGDEFKRILIRYLLNNISKNLPSIFKNITFIYHFQQYKLPILSEIIGKNLESIEKSGEISKEIFPEETGQIPDRRLQTLFIWFYYLASQHYQMINNNELALKYINLAINSTPSVVEFYSVKSKILKHCLNLEEAILAAKKAYQLDLSDRYLNAKLAKSYLRNGDFTNARKIMNEFVKDPNLEVNMIRYQCMWYELENGLCFLKNGLYLNAHYMFRGLLTNFEEMKEDQNDFYNYSLRRFMLNDFYKLIIINKNL